MSGEKESKVETLTLALGLFSKINPLVLGFCLILLNLFSYVYNSEMQLHLKFFGLISIGFFFLAALFYENQRIKKEREAREKVLW